MSRATDPRVVAVLAVHKAWLDTGNKDTDAAQLFIERLDVFSWPTDHVYRLLSVILELAPVEQLDTFVAHAAIEAIGLEQTLTEAGVECDDSPAERAATHARIATMYSKLAEVGVSLPREHARVSCEAKCEATS